VLRDTVLRIKPAHFVHVSFGAKKNVGMIEFVFSTQRSS